MSDWNNKTTVHLTVGIQRDKDAPMGMITVCSMVITTNSFDEPTWITNINPFLLVFILKIIFSDYDILSRLYRYLFSGYVQMLTVLYVVKICRNLIENLNSVI